MLCRRIHLFQDIHRIVGVHLGDDLCGALDRKLLQVRLRIIQICEDLRNALHTDQRV